MSCICACLPLLHGQRGANCRVCTPLAHTLSTFSASRQATGGYGNCGACPGSQALCGARNCCLRPGKPGSAWREQLRLMPRKAKPYAARATMARKCFGTRSRNGVETPKPVATSTAAAQPLISRQLATPRTAFRSKPRCLDSPISCKAHVSAQFATPRTAFRPKPRHREPPNRDERSSASSYYAASTTSLLTAASQQAAMLRILNAEASTVRATRRANSLAAMPFLAEVG